MPFLMKINIRRDGLVGKIPCKHETLSLDPRIFVKSQQWECTRAACEPGDGEMLDRDRKAPEASLAYVLKC